MISKKILVFTILAAAFIQVLANDDDEEASPNGLQRLASSAASGAFNVLDSGANAAASGMDLSSTAVANGMKAVGGAADVANNVQKIGFNKLRQTRRGVGRVAHSVSNLSSAALTGTLRRSADAVKDTQHAGEFVLGETDKIRGAGGKVAQSLISNLSGSLVNGLDGINKLVNSGGEVREEVAGTAGAIHDAGTELVKEGIRTWKDMGLVGFGSFRKGLQDARKRFAGAATNQNADTGEAKAPATRDVTDTKTPPKEEPKSGGGWLGGWI